MNLRMIKIFLPLENKTKAEEVLKECNVSDFWHDRISEKKILIRALVPAQENERFLDILENVFQGVDGFRVIILPVEASIPRIKEKEAKEKESGRISREELYSRISGNVSLSSNYFFLIVFAAIVAAVGLVYGNIPMVVGAMIIAPLLSPSVALSFATTLGDFSLAWRALKVTFVGVVLAIVFSAIIGLLFPVNTTMPEIAMRSEVAVGDLIVSFVSGSVGVLSFTTATLTSLAGVMVAVSLLPPLVVSGMLLGSGEFTGAGGALLLFFVNLVGINLAGVVTFLAQKIRPRTVFEFTKAQLLTFFALFFWVIFLFAVILFLLR